MAHFTATESEVNIRMDVPAGPKGHRFWKSSIRLSWSSMYNLDLQQERGFHSPPPLEPPKVGCPVLGLVLRTCTAHHSQFPKGVHPPPLGGHRKTLQKSRAELRPPAWSTHVGRTAAPQESPAQPDSTTLRVRPEGPHLCFLLEHPGILWPHSRGSG